jgi:flagellar motility protein MotE (MotC chaperone)
MSMRLYDIRTTASSKIIFKSGKGAINYAVAIAIAAALAILLVLQSFSSPSSAQEKPASAAASGTSLEEERLKILKADIQAQIEQLKKLKQELEQEKKGLEGKKKEQLVKVAKIYESMPAEEAAKAIEKLDDDTAILILTSLKPRTAGKVLGQIESARAASLSKKALQKYK